MIERLYRAKWSRSDGLGGLVLTPTRELAMQIFEELKKVRTTHAVEAISIGKLFVNKSFAN